ncbi:hypothetical protein CcCBS67573_g00578 [Chytriomyces confervae]|uniref:tRNA(His) guanylyltransferase n=1 Tax=Chytriomyces confervae TaxID=246404 RepID=A0A507FPE6_9FUNG|nr:hypothetical protein HDU80_001430 [Chytriomyces hyalinus]TPX78152.1 hypothetical protein CcCBS67573_g00578 [Chytriomyces confervae]
MAKSKFEYVKHFEQHQTLLRNTWIVVRIDGHGFHRFSAEHDFAKPNDIRALHLANEAARGVMLELNDIVFAYGESDEFSFVLKRDSTLFKRREAKIISTVASLFTAHYVVNWGKFMDGTAMKYPPSFDARAVCYPTNENLRDYISWRQADCHINNLYNTTFWALVLDTTATPPTTTTRAQEILKDTTSATKNELLFTKFNINYNMLPEIFRKGSILYRTREKVAVKEAQDGSSVEREKSLVHVGHFDVIGDEWWVNGSGASILR